MSYELYLDRKLTTCMIVKIISKKIIGGCKTMYPTYGGPMVIASQDGITIICFPIVTRFEHLCNQSVNFRI